MTDRTSDPAAEDRRRAPLPKTPWRVGQPIRAVLALALPWAVCFAAGAPAAALWLCFGALRALLSESGDDYPERLRRAVAGSMIGAAGFLAGLLGGLPWGATVAAMATAGFLATILSSYGALLSAGATQALLIACLTIGLPEIASGGTPPLLYLAGLAIYAAPLGIEALFARGVAPAAATQTPAPALRHPRKHDGLVPNAATLGAAAAAALCLGLAYAARWIDDAEHWFWIPLTVGLVMKPDLGSVPARAVLRVAGTVLGAAIGAALLVLTPKNVWLAAPLALFAALLPAAMRRSFGLLAVAVTPVILIVVGSMEPGDIGLAFGAQRVIDTAIGGAIVLVFGCIPWPRAPTRPPPAAGDP